MLIYILLLNFTHFLGIFFVLLPVDFEAGFNVEVLPLPSALDSSPANNIISGIYYYIYT